MGAFISWFTLQTFANAERSRNDMAIEDNLIYMIQGRVPCCSVKRARKFATKVRKGLRLSAVLHEIGEGSFGKVYRSEERTKNGTTRTIAIKTVFATSGFQFCKPILALFVDKIDTEAAHLKKLNHPNIIRGYNSVELVHEDYRLPMAYFISMEYMQINVGKLCKFPRLLKLHLYHVGSFVLQVAGAIEYLHGLGIIHRDIKPSNIMATFPDDVNPNEVSIACSGATYKIGDFGSVDSCPFPVGDASLVKEVLGLISEGTEFYFSPEVKKIYNNPRTEDRAVNPYLIDTYAFGMVVMTMLLGIDSMEEAVQEKMDLKAFWASKENILCRQPNGEPLTEDSEWTKPMQEAFKALGELVEPDPLKRRFVDNDFINLFKPF